MGIPDVRFTAGGSAGPEFFVDTKQQIHGGHNFQGFAGVAGWPEQLEGVLQLRLLGYGRGFLSWDPSHLLSEIGETDSSIDSIAAVEFGGCFNGAFDDGIAGIGVNLAVGYTRTWTDFERRDDLALTAGVYFHLPVFHILAGVRLLPTMEPAYERETPGVAGSFGFSFGAGW